MRCVICDYCDDEGVGLSLSSMRETFPRGITIRLDEKTGNPICSDCTAASIDYHNSFHLSKAVNLDAVTEEMRDRIPQLFEGPECPSFVACACTKTCKLLAAKSWEDVLEAEGLEALDNIDIMDKNKDMEDEWEIIGPV